MGINDKNTSEAKIVNRTTAMIYSVIAFILVVAYIIEALKGRRTIGYLIIFFSIVLIPAIINTGYEIKNPENKLTKYFLPIGYLVLYAFVLFTGNTLATYAYIIPFLMVFPLFHNWKYTGIYSGSALLLNIIFSVIQFRNGRGSDPDFVTDSEIQLAVVLLTSLYGLITSYIDTKMVERRMSDVHKEKKITEDILIKIKNLAYQVEQKVNHINTMTEQLNTASITTKDAMEQVCAGSDSAAETVQNEMVQLDSMSEDLDTISNVVDSFKQNVDHQDSIIEVGNQNMTELKSASEKTISTSESTMMAMETLMKKIGNIENIMQMIESIASQTNLLSLNASIEAARAGEAGRGFAVVANEIRNLSNQTKESLLQIKNEIETITKSSQDVAEDMGKLNHIFIDQNKFVTNTASIFAEITESSLQMKEQCHSIVDSLNQIQAVKMEIISSISNVGAVCEEVTANAQNTLDLNLQNVSEIKMLNTDIEELNNMVGELTQ
mgnify:FL=1